MKTELVNLLQSALKANSVDITRVEPFMRTIAGGKLCSCAKTGVPGLEDLDARLVGNDEDLLESYILDMISLKFGNDLEGKDVIVTTIEGGCLAKLLRSNEPRMVSKEILEQSIFSIYGIEGSLSSEIGDNTEGDIEEEDVAEQDEELTGDTEDLSDSDEEVQEDVEEESEDDIEEEPEEPEEDGPDTEIEDSSTDKEDKSVEDYIEKASYYMTKYGGQLENLGKVYTSLFESGYSVRKPTGILCTEGIISLTGIGKLNKLTDTSKSQTASAKPVYASNKDITIKLLYRLFGEKMKFYESDSRSISAISNDILEAYNEPNKPLVYFPYKMLEFAYGRKAPKGTNANSKNTYTAQAVANSWSEYYDKELKDSLERQLGNCLGQLSEHLEGLNKSEREIEDTIQDFTIYFIQCFSLCILIPDFRMVNRRPMVLKVRVSDPRNNLGMVNLMPEIIQEVYGGARGKEPITQDIAVYGEDAIVKEYAHEFNQTLSQAMPIFAYKALEVLLSQGEKPDWNSMVLGQYENGSILRNGINLDVAGHDAKGGTQVQINLKKYLSHVISAGSRAGKGVTTLSFLTNAIASGKAIFYLDRKPDMASVLKRFVNEDEGKDLPPQGMFVLNGSDWLEDMDSFRQWENANSFILQEHIPDYVIDLFGANRNDLWYGAQFGDLFYMRAFKLIFGLIIARNSHKEILGDPQSGGMEGIVLIADEVTNFQSGYQRLLDTKSVLDKMPPFITQLTKTVSTIEQKTKELEISTGKAQISVQAAIDSAKRTIEKLYTKSGYYLVTLLTSMRRDIDYVNSIRNAGNNELATATADVITIGQALDHVQLTSAHLGNILDNGRYKSDQCGVQGGLQPLQDGFTNLSLLEFFVRYQKTDAILGRNTGEHKYLAQTDERSPAYGKVNDKARYFGYIPDFSDTDQKNVNSLEVAKKAIYFKPYLILNDCQPSQEKDKDGFRNPGESYTETLIGFSEINGLSKEELVSEYGNYQEVDKDHPSGTFLHPAVGLGAYLEAMGVTDVAQVLSKSGPIADHIVRDFLGYTGVECNIPLWLQFVTDLRMEWEFSVEDIVRASTKPTILSHNNPNLKEYNEFLEEVAKIGGNQEPEEASNGEGFRFKDNSPNYSVEEQAEIDEQVSEAQIAMALNAKEDTGDGFEDMFSNSSDDPRGDTGADGTEDLMDEPDYLGDISDVQEDEVRDGSGAFNVAYQKNRIGDYVVEDDLTKEDTDIDDLIRKLEQAGYHVSKPLGNDVRVAQDGSGVETSYNSAPQSSSFTMEDIDSGRFYHTAPDEPAKSVDFHNISSNDAAVTDEIKANSYKQLVKMVTNKLIKDFGGLGRIASFKIVGGGIVVNNSLYRCSVDRSCADMLPFDIKTAINAGQIACLFDYSCLPSMKNLNTLSIDSVDHAYNYVAPMMGYSDGVSVDKFFHDLKSLNILVLGSETFTRENHRQKMKEEDVFYAPTKAARYSSAVHNGVKKANQSVWNATKHVAANKSYPNLIRIVGALGLGALAVGLGVARAGTSVVKDVAEEGSARKNVRGYFEKARGFFGGISSSIKDAFDNGNNN